MLGELRAEKRGTKEQVTEHRALTSQTMAAIGLFVAVFGVVIGDALIKLFGG